MWGNSAGQGRKTSRAFWSQLESCRPDFKLLPAVNLRENMLRYLQPDNRRQLKEATSALYIMHNAKNPAVLVECGFLSNAKEEKLLCDSNYQSEITLVLLSGLIRSNI